MHFCVYLETLFVSRLRVQRYAFFLNLQAFGRFFSRKSAFFYCSLPFSFLLGSFFCLFVSFRPLPVSLSPFVLFLSLPFLCRFCFSCIFLLSRLLFCVLPFFCFSYFLFLISPFSHFHSFSSRLYTTVHCFASAAVGNSDPLGSFDVEPG